MGADPVQHLRGSESKRGRRSAWLGSERLPLVLCHQGGPSEVQSSKRKIERSDGIYGMDSP